MRRKVAVKSSRISHDSVFQGGQEKASVLVRPIRQSDFEFIQQLSATIDGYTVPPSYVLWMLLTFQRELCIVSVGPAQEPLGYMLGMSVGLHSNEMFIWQLATTFPGQRLRVGTKLANHVRKMVKKHGIQRITFTAVPDSATTRSIASLAHEIFGCTVRTSTRLPRSISARERQFYFVP